MKRLLIYTSMTNSTVLQIRKIIFENFNEIDLRFNNDEIYELLKKNEIFDQSQTIDDLEKSIGDLMQQAGVEEGETATTASPK